MSRGIFFLFLFLFSLSISVAQPGISAPVPSQQPGPHQLAQIQRKYGMFIHFGINTFWDQEWTDGSKPPASYKPAAVDADQCYPIEQDKEK